MYQSPLSGMAKSIRGVLCRASPEPTRMVDSPIRVCWSSYWLRAGLLMPTGSPDAASDALSGCVPTSPFRRLVSRTAIRASLLRLGYQAAVSVIDTLVTTYWPSPENSKELSRGAPPRNTGVPPSSPHIPTCVTVLPAGISKVISASVATVPSEDEPQLGVCLA